MILKSPKVRWAILLLIILTLFSIACTAGPNSLTGTEAAKGKPANFVMGLWHGFIMLFSFIISLFSDKVSVYEVHNVGNWYNFGFLLGAMSFFGGSGGSAGKRRRRDYD